MTKLVVIIGFVVWFGAGLVVGLNLRRADQTKVTDGRDPSPASRPDRDRRHGGSFLEGHLGLTREQKQAMDKIWSDMGRHSPWEQEDKRRQFRREKDEAIAALVRPEDYGKYDQILQTYSDRLAAMEKDAKTAFGKAVEETKKILNDEQRGKYEAFLKRHDGPRRGPGPGPGGGPGGGGGERNRGDGKRQDKDKDHGRKPGNGATSAPAVGSPR